MIIILVVEDSICSLCAYRWICIYNDEIHNNIIMTIRHQIITYRYYYDPCAIDRETIYRVKIQTRINEWLHASSNRDVSK